MAPGRLWDADVPLPDEISVVAGFDLSSPILDLATPFMMTDDSPTSRAVRARHVLQAFGGVLRGPRMNQRGGRAAEEHVRPVMR